MTAADDIRRARDDFERKATVGLRLLAMRIFNNTVDDTPVDKGALINSWDVSINRPPPSKINTPDKLGAASEAAIERGLDEFKLGDTIWFANLMPYAEHVEVGTVNFAGFRMLRNAINRHWPQGEAIFKAAL